jgi:hypothetical protein
MQYINLMLWRYFSCGNQRSADAVFFDEIGKKIIKIRNIIASSNLG